MRSLLGFFATAHWLLQGARPGGTRAAHRRRGGGDNCNGSKVLPVACCRFRRFARYITSAPHNKRKNEHSAIPCIYSQRRRIMIIAKVHLRRHVLSTAHRTALRMPPSTRSVTSLAHQPLLPSASPLPALALPTEMHNSQLSGHLGRDPPAGQPLFCLMSAAMAGPTRRRFPPLLPPPRHPPSLSPRNLNRNRNRNRNRNSPS
ncbi:hypothetical protein CALCODRAFT_85229 [Calocera cornea HHB12733]|uniref:Secreted protein n=1 Tax=Calocera cornea HHB12733 TaxID=1353952 RepID=A0A165INH1_9BASI|nr:hypothetical protein CALCODRAFT_85229 [Calocera cornea HHB12733]